MAAQLLDNRLLFERARQVGWMENGIRTAMIQLEHGDTKAALNSLANALNVPERAEQGSAA